MAKAINKLVGEIKGRAEENAISSLAVRSMSKALYTTDNIGHYGLAFKYYTHFTSPIRRYQSAFLGTKSHASFSFLSPSIFAPQLGQ